VEDKKVLKVEIDKGSRDGQRITFSGESDEAPGLKAGDLIFVLKQREHELFKRRGHHLIMEQELPLVNALCGGDFAVIHLDGRVLLVTLAPGSVIVPDSVHEVRNEGMPVAGRTYEHGSLYIKFRVSFPPSLPLKVVEALKAQLPSALPTVMRTPDHVPVSLTAADANRFGDDGDDDNHGHRGGNAYDEDDDDDDEDGGGGHPHGVQCAQQ
jgi:DnaJ family protein A protein 2